MRSERGGVRAAGSEGREEERVHGAGGEGRGERRACVWPTARGVGHERSACTCPAAAARGGARARGRPRRRGGRARGLPTVSLLGGEGLGALLGLARAVMAVEQGSPACP